MEMRGAIISHLTGVAGASLRQRARSHRTRR